jgi:hypothetical protein
MHLLKENTKMSVHYVSNLEACTFVVNQDQAFEVGFHMKINCV